jgi:hypothetical protein
LLKVLLDVFPLNTFSLHPGENPEISIETLIGGNRGLFDFAFDKRRLLIKGFFNERPLGFTDFKGFMVLGRTEELFIEANFRSIFLASIISPSVKFQIYVSRLVHQMEK